MAKHDISRFSWHKGYVFLLTYVKWMAACYWSTIQCKEDLGSAEIYRAHFQGEHDKQIDAMIRRDIEIRRQEGERIDIDESKTIQLETK
jgi:hypothetical protein